MPVSDETRKAVRNQLGASGHANAFECRFDLEDGAALSVMLRGNERHHFVARERPSPLSPEKPWEVRQSPGPMFRGAETLRFQSLEEAAAQLGDWVRRVSEEEGL